MTSEGMPSGIGVGLEDSMFNISTLSFFSLLDKASKFGDSGRWRVCRRRSGKIKIQNTKNNKSVNSYFFNVTYCMSIINVCIY